MNQMDGEYSDGKKIYVKEARINLKQIQIHEEKISQ